MGKRLLPAVQVRNTIKGMVQSGAICGEKADAWKKRLEEEQEVEKMRKRAERGNKNAMHTMGEWHRYGFKGLTKDMKKAFYRFKKASDLKHVPSMGMCGWAYVAGGGVEKDVARIHVVGSGRSGGLRGCVLGDEFAYGRNTKRPGGGCKMVAQGSVGALPAQE